MADEKSPVRISHRLFLINRSEMRVTMQNVLIVEDDELQASMIFKTIHDTYPDWVITHTTNFEETIKIIDDSVHNTNFTLFLLDIHLIENEHDNGGYVIAKHLRNINVYFKTPILFLTSVTGDERYAMSNFHCYNYITKPYTSDDILSEISQMLLTGYLENMIILCDTNRIKHHISINDIIYIETNNRRKTICLKDSSCLVTSMYTFDDFIRMTDSRLIQCHKHYLINPNYINNTDRLNRCLNICGNNIPIGRKYQEDFFKCIE